MVARQCGDFWTTFGPASIDLVKGNSCKFRGLAGQRGIACRWQGALWLAAALGSLFLWMGLTGLTMNGPAPILAKTKLPFEAFKGQLRNPSDDMPAYSDAVLSDKDIADIYAFVQTLPGPSSAKDIAILNN